MNPSISLPRAVLELDRFALRDADALDAPVLTELAGRGENRTLFGLTNDEAAFASGIGKPGFEMPMLASSDGVPVGAAGVAFLDLRSRHAQIACFFADCEGAQLPLSMYVRQLYWLAPLNRIDIRIPRAAGGAAYEDLLTAAGFTLEGVLRGHAIVSGEPCPMSVYGLLRNEFDAWCERCEPRLSL